MPTTSLNLANIEKAAQLIDPVFLHSPQYEDVTLNAALGGRVLVKVETANPIRSFKGRGTDFFASSLDRKRKIVCASAGNFGQAMAYSGRRRGIPVQVFAANDVNPAKAERMRALGARVTLCDGDFDAAKQNARQHAAKHPECIFVEDGAEDAITEGAGTIGVELLAAGKIDTVVVPLGDGALITGIGAWIKDRLPRTQIIGVCPEGSPAMLESWRQGRPIPGEAHTIADGIAVTAPVPKSIERMKNLVDDIVLVDDNALIEAMRLAVSTLGLLLEPSGAAGLAAIMCASGKRIGATAKRGLGLGGNKLSGDRVATILTGSNVHPGLLARIMNSAP